MGYVATMRFTHLFLLTGLLLTGCVSPLVNHTPYAVPYFPKSEFERLFTAWKGGKAVTWQVAYKGSAFSDQELVLRSTGDGSLGAKLQGVEKQPKTFTVTKAELNKLVTAMIDSGIFGLYDGHYAAWTHAGGLGGPEIRVEVAGMIKRVSKDPGLSGAISWEASAIEKVNTTILEIGQKHL